MSKEQMTSHELRAELSALHEAAWAWSLMCCRGDRPRAEDVLQSAYVKALEGIGGYRADSTVKTWLFGIIRYTALSDWRVRLRRVELLERWFQEEQEIAQAPRAGVVESLLRGEQHAQLKEALAALSQRQREILTLVFYHELSIEEAAQVMGLPVGTARTHYARGKKQLLGRLLSEDERGLVVRSEVV